LAQARYKEESIKRLTAAQEGYFTVVQGGIAVQKLAATAEEKAELTRQKNERTAIAASVAYEEQKKKFGANSKLAAEQRAKEMESQIAQAKATAVARKLGVGIDAGQVDKDLENQIHAIKEHYKDPKGKSTAAADRDSLSAKQKALENIRKDAERESKMQLDRVNSEHKRGLVNDEEYINQKADIEEKSLNNSIGFFKREIEVAKKKVNSLKEIQTLTGNIAKAESDIKDKQKEKEYALLELQYKQYEIRKKFNEADANKQYDDKQKEIDSLVQSNEQLRLQNELIGKNQEQISKITLTRQQKIISDKEDALIGLKNLDIITEEINLQGQLVNVLERNTQERELAIQQGEREIEQ
jgi:hypothetical protein